MTRWARGGNANKKKALSSTPWSELKRQSTCLQTEPYSTKEIQYTKSHETEIIGKKKFKHKQTRHKFSEKNSTLDKYQKDKCPVSTILTHEPKNYEVNAPRNEVEPVKLSVTGGKTKDKNAKQKEESDNSLQEKIQDISASNLDESIEKQICEVVKKTERSERRRLDRKEKRATEKLCFNCRKPGHDMSDCPETKLDVSHGTGICFKCGSTEHSVATCRVKLPPGEYPYAKCFICGEMGHLSKQCPDNPRGLYPKGGCCRLCGSVEHYRKDCPELQKRQGIKDYTLPTISHGHFSVDDEISLHKPQRPAVKQKKCKFVTF